MKKLAKVFIMLLSITPWIIVNIGTSLVFLSVLVLVTNPVNTHDWPYIKYFNVVKSINDFCINIVNQFKNLWRSL